jgi:glycosyltransferase involved in cell wall biosynthesis
MDAELWLIGDGPQVIDVKAILNNGSGRNVKYWGATQNVGSLLKRADMLLLNSHYESFSLAALEAMACGVPVLAAEMGGIPEVVRHGETGFLFRQGHIREAADFAKSLLTSPALHRSMRKAALKQAERFCISRILPLYETFYAKNLKTRHKQTYRDSRFFSSLNGQNLMLKKRYI